MSKRANGFHPADRRLPFKARQSVVEAMSASCSPRLFLESSNDRFSVNSFLASMPVKGSVRRVEDGSVSRIHFKCRAIFFSAVVSSTTYFSKCV